MIFGMSYERSADANKTFCRHLRTQHHAKGMLAVYAGTLRTTFVCLHTTQWFLQCPQACRCLMQLCFVCCECKVAYPTPCRKLDVIFRVAQNVFGITQKPALGVLLSALEVVVDQRQLAETPRTTIWMLRVLGAQARTFLQLALIRSFFGVFWTESVFLVEVLVDCAPRCSAKSLFLIHFESSNPREEPVSEPGRS